jgi:hypothetical protein
MDPDPDPQHCLDGKLFFEFLKASIADLITLLSLLVKKSEGGGNGIVCNIVWLSN